MKMSVCSLHAWAMLFVAISWVTSAEAQVGETKEIVYSSDDARWLKEKADELKTPVAIYEYVRNSFDYQPYWGSWGGAVNTFAAKRGNDVDIASTLIAMLRSQGVPSRYAVANIRMPNTQVLNWLGLGNIDFARRYLKLAGTPEVGAHTLYQNTTYFEHTWVEALVPFDEYRGLPMDGAPVNCQTTPSRCHWVSLDASFKQKKYLNNGLDPYPSVKWDATDYTSYYDAMLNNDSYRKDKSLIHILESDVLSWLRTNYPNAGYTLDDVTDVGEIIAVHHGLLPTSLPFEVDFNLRRYNTVADHDAVEAAASIQDNLKKAWDRKLTIALNPCDPKLNQDLADKFQVSYSEVATERIMLTYSAGSGGGVNLNITKGRGASPTVIKTWAMNSSYTCIDPSTGNPFNKGFGFGSDFLVRLEGDIEPGYLSAVPKVTKSAIVGGRYLVATGGESSNWGQVHRAASALLEAGRTHKIVYNTGYKLPGQTSCAVATGAGCVPFLDTGPAGWDASDQKVIDNPAATQDLIGGLLEVAASQYFAKIRDHYKRADGLMRIKTPIRRFAGLMRSNYDVQYLRDGTAFGIQPNGLVIDMSFALADPVRLNATTLTTDLDHYYFVMHMASSLEHEIWQELTGFDAMSTVRSIQVARAASSPLKTYQKKWTSSTTLTNDAVLFAQDMGFTQTTGDCIDSAPYRCRPYSESTNISKYSTNTVGQLYTTIKNFSPLKNLSDTRTVTTNMGTQVIRGPGYLEVKVTESPSSGTTFKSEVFIIRQHDGTVSSGEVVEGLTFGIDVTGR